jgi:5-(aminomethyl)-3-furanmethanol phosphate kinase
VIDSAARPINVIKIGGGLTSIPGALDRVCQEVSAAAARYRMIVVPGGGPFADAVRTFDRSFPLSPGTAHWMALLAMDQYAHVLVDRIAGAVLVDEPGSLLQCLNAEHVAVLAPSRWLRSADVLPRTWEVTSDSIAAFVAGAMDAARLILIKPAANLDEPVDSHFTSALPYGMPWSLVACDRLEELAEQLSG